MKEGRKKVIWEIKIEIDGIQHLIDNETGVVQKLAQEDMVKLLNKKKTAASSEQDKSKKKRVARVRI